MRGDDDLVELEQRSRIGLGGEDIERRTADLARAQRLEQRVLVDELAARGVHEPDPSFMRAKAARRGGRASRREREMERNEVGVGEHLLQGLGARDAELAEALAADVGVVHEHVHLEPDGAPRDLLADPAEAEHAQRLVRELLPRPPRPLPAACFSAACACGMLRESASSIPIACSAAETTVDSGAFATTMPRRVAASTSTLSTPTPARPITFRRSARWIRSASSFVPDRITIAS